MVEDGGAPAWGVFRGLSYTLCSAGYSLNWGIKGKALGITGFLGRRGGRRGLGNERGVRVVADSGAKVGERRLVERFCMR